MPTTRRRVNLTLTELEERFVDAITNAGTPEHDAFVRYLGASDAGGGEQSEVSAPGLADMVHVMLRIGMDRLEFEAAEISYAAEAAAQSAGDQARTEALRNRLIAAVARTDG